MFLYRTIGQYAIRPGLRILYRAEVAGSERIPGSGPCIVVSNHESTIDPFVVGLATRRVIRWMAKAELWENPLVARAIESFAAFPVERGRGDRSAFDAAHRLLADEEIIGIFPQGTCAPLRRRPFLRTAARLALETGSPLVPVGLVGTERIIRPHKFKLGLPKIRVLVADRIDVEPEKPTLARARELTDRVEETIAALVRPYGEPAHVWIDE